MSFPRALAGRQNAHVDWQKTRQSLHGVAGVLCNVSFMVSSSSTALMTLALARAAFTHEHRSRRERQGATTHLSADARCEHLFTNKSEAAVWPPPRQMPDELRDRYTMGGRSGVSTMYFQGKQNGAVQRWNAGAIHKFSSMCASQGNGSTRYPSDRAAICLEETLDALLLLLPLNGVLGGDVLLQGAYPRGSCHRDRLHGSVRRDVAEIMRPKRSADISHAAQVG